MRYLICLTAILSVGCGAPLNQQPCWPQEKTRLQFARSYETLTLRSMTVTGIVFYGKPVVELWFKEVPWSVRFDSVSVDRDEGSVEVQLIGCKGGVDSFKIIIDGIAWASINGQRKEFVCTASDIRQLRVEGVRCLPLNEWRQQKGYPPLQQ